MTVEELTVLLTVSSRIVGVSHRHDWWWLRPPDDVPEREIKSAMRVRIASLKSEDFVNRMKEIDP